MSELIMDRETVSNIMNMSPRVEFILTFDEREAIQEFMHGTPTDHQQLQVYYICQAIVESYSEWKRKKENDNGKGI